MTNRTKLAKKGHHAYPSRTGAEVSAYSWEFYSAEADNTRFVPPSPPNTGFPGMPDDKIHRDAERKVAGTTLAGTAVGALVGGLGTLTPMGALAGAVKGMAYAESASIGAECGYCHLFPEDKEE